MTLHFARTVALALAAGATALAASGSALAERESFAVNNATYKSECGSCHVAYPPALLPARSWQAILGGLDRHFGTNASPDEKSLAEIRAFLEKNAGRDRTGGTAPVLRITETSWFKREHSEVAASTWNSTKVKRPSNCAACHKGAEQGDFDEDSISIPR